MSQDDFSKVLATSKKQAAVYNNVNKSVSYESRQANDKKKIIFDENNRSHSNQQNN
eukprot:CAMPEP_0116886886 /NCGR_PEP_ID=MMETSP0463-20121206/20890_1 /TAXON_ID=181622 /ORGANISM="Strombidinopsis sp, Strain SopsisLIS2011" /LENGTH=55 /DNA_ID=CAMNT_0004548063 /DNA_START=284 /DNA_END=451 /DNA_ORIENTATION=-